ncbi:PLP-dependent cysteine synthase family protein [Pseudonocardia bannensis]|uniref:Pyridoxal-phosphate dependent enzyme n=1 Tax=Pseudonocardia bannensis TaxID=630973 RepID=A0A848DEE5_9PSEU|nr:pyridoxal-phosphate dependent enzyme [Pseudonocardia bannensis]NMH91028.1 pyridoxal-phosphate dependent enzyme [Pseudonocardia bannensis]
MTTERTRTPGPVHDSLLDAIGATPLVRLDRVTAGLPAAVYVKAEFANPGGSVKDRAALAMIDEAERSGALAPGGTVVEGTSGNTGMGLAMVAARRGYRCIVVVPDRTAREKIALLRAYGAEVVLTPGTVPREDPRHVIMLAERIAAETPGGWLADQYGNPANPRVHELTTGPEIWAQTEGRITHFVAGVGTGGTISGTSRHLREISGGRVTIVGADPESSVYAGGDGSPYYVEAIGHYLHPQTAQDVWPTVYDTSAVDRFERIPDRESLATVRRLAREEGLLVGGSAGTAIAAALRVAATAGPGDVVVAVAPDSGRAYLSKYFDDEWLTQLGFLDAPDGPRVRDRVGAGPDGLVVVPATDSVGAALHGLAAVGPVPAAVPVVAPRRTDAASWSVGDIVGSVRLAALRDAVAADPAAADGPVAGHMGPAPATVGAGETAAAALVRLGPDDGRPLLLLVDGRAVRAVVRADLA